MDIPDEAIESICRRTEDELRVVLLDFTRAAQVAILRELEDQFVRCSTHWTARGDDARASVYAVEGAHLRRKLGLLEAGAGQTGEVRAKAAWERANGTHGPFGWADLAEDEKDAWRNAGQTGEGND